MFNIEFSVIIPLYNKRNSILNTLNSVKSQKVTASEIIVVDDGSTDGGIELVEQLNWPEIRIIKQSNQGVSAARNLGAKEAEYQYLAFLDADDEWLPLYLADISKLILNFPQQTLYATAYQKKVGPTSFEDPKICLTEQTPEGYVMENYFEVAGKGDLPFMISCSVVRKHFFDAVDGFPTDEWMGEDQSFFAEAALKKAIAYMPQIRMLYHTDSENRVCEKQPPQKICEFASRLIQRIDSQKMPLKLQRHLKTYVAAHICNLAKRNVRAKQHLAALRLLKHPLSWFKPLHLSYWYSRSLIGWIFSGFAKSKSS